MLSVYKYRAVKTANKLSHRGRHGRFFLGWGWGGLAKSCGPSRHLANERWAEARITEILQSKISTLVRSQIINRKHCKVINLNKNKQPSSLSIHCRFTGSGGSHIEMKLKWNWNWNKTLSLLVVINFVCSSFISVYFSFHFICEREQL